MEQYLRDPTEFRDFFFSFLPLICSLRKLYSLSKWVSIFCLQYQWPSNDSPSLFSAYSLSHHYFDSRQNCMPSSSLFRWLSHLISLMEICKMLLLFPLVCISLVQINVILHIKGLYPSSVLNCHEKRNLKCFLEILYAKRSEQYSKITLYVQESTAF